MCVVSMIGDHYDDKWREPWNGKINNTGTTYTFTNNSVSKEEFESLKKEVEEMKQLLIKAKIYDEKNNEPDCELEDKVAFLKKIAEAVGVDLEEVFKS